MGFLDSISRKKSSGMSTLGGVHDEYEESFIDIFKIHLQHIKEVNPLTISFLDKYFGNDQISFLSRFAVQKMSLTQSDNKEHSIAFYEKPVCYQICTLAMELEKARDWFVHRYGGYTKLLEQSWQTRDFQASGCKVLCHIVFGQTNGNAWIQLAIIPVHKKFSMKQMLLPIEFLTSEERRISGL